MQWTFRLTHPSIQNIKPDRPIGLVAILWLVALFLVSGCAGGAVAIAAIPASVLAIGALAIIAIIWLTTYSWLGGGQQTAADWLMVLVGIVGAWIGLSVNLFLDPRAFADGGWLLIGILPMTGAFRGTANSVALQFRAGEDNTSKLLSSLPLVLLSSLQLAGLGFWWSTTAGWGRSSAILIISAAMVVPLGLYFFLAYSLLPSLSIDGLNRVIQQLPNFFNAAGEPTPSQENPPPQDPLATDTTDRLQTPNFSLDEWAKIPQLKMQLLFYVPLILVPLLLTSAIYWAIVYGVGGFFIEASAAICQISTPVDWGWDWLKAWASIWLLTLVLAIVKIFQNPLNWISLLQTTSVLSQSLLT